MNRCNTLLCALALLLFSSSCLAQLHIRPFPAGTMRGAMQVTQPPNLLLDGKPERFSPGARIRNANNTLVLSAGLVGQLYVVNYLREPHGLIHEVWILNGAEAELPLPGKP